MQEAWNRLELCTMHFPCRLDGTKISAQSSKFVSIFLFSSALTMFFSSLSVICHGFLFLGFFSSHGCAGDLYLSSFSLITLFLPASPTCSQRQLLFPFVFSVLCTSAFPHALVHLFASFHLCQIYFCFFLMVSTPGPREIGLRFPFPPLPRP